MQDLGGTVTAALNGELKEAAAAEGGGRAMGTKAAGGGAQGGWGSLHRFEAAKAAMGTGGSATAQGIAQRSGEPWADDDPPPGLG